MFLCRVDAYSAGQRGVASHSRAFRVVECIMLHDLLLKFYVNLLPDAENTKVRETASISFIFVIINSKYLL